MKLTKSEYMQGRTCTTKIAHARAQMPKRTDQDPFYTELASVGAIVHWLAPFVAGGAKYGYSLDDVLRHGYGTYAEVEAESAARYARIDILSYRASTMTIMEVKSEKLPMSTVTGEPLHCLTDSGEIHHKWRDLIDDLTFQYLVVLEQLVASGIDMSSGEIELRADLILMNPEFDSTKNDLRHQFDVDPESQRVTYHGNLDELVNAGILILMDVTDIVQKCTLQRVYTESNRMIAELAASQRPTLTKSCASCEYRVKASIDTDTGFNRCWGELAVQTPFVLDLAEVGRLKAIDEIDAITAITNTGSARMTDLPLDILWSGYNNRQHRQIISAATSSALIDSALREVLQYHAYPRVCIDVEAFASAFPYWESTRPYEITTFQWSAHTIKDASFTMDHAEWLHESTEHPCVAFLTSLHDALNHAATIYTWSPYERTAVSTARSIANRLGILSDELNAWVDWFIDRKNPQIVDMLALARLYYMHPALKGSHSIKSVLPTIWNTDQEVRGLFPEYIKMRNGELLSPYATLPRLDAIGNLSDVADGTTAISAYAALVHPTRLSEPERNQVRTSLLEYCKLDTAAMVMIMKGWM